MRKIGIYNIKSVIHDPSEVALGKYYYFGKNPHILVRNANAANIMPRMLTGVLPESDYPFIDNKGSRYVCVIPCSDYAEKDSFADLLSANNIGIDSLIVVKSTTPPSVGIVTAVKDNYLEVVLEKTYIPINVFADSIDIKSSISYTFRNLYPSILYDDFYRAGAADRDKERFTVTRVVSDITASRQNHQVYLQKNSKDKISFKPENPLTVDFANILNQFRFWKIEDMWREIEFKIIKNKE